MVTRRSIDRIARLACASPDHSRRRFGALVAAALATARLPAVAHAAPAAPTGAAPLRLIKPPALKPGDTVGLIAPGGWVDDDVLQKCVLNLESLGFRVKPGANIRAVRGGYAGTVAQRLADLHHMFLDNEVKAIWTARGGSGCTGLLPQLRYGMVRNHPKILIGYSDITALHLALYRHAGLITFHGPVASSALSDYSVKHMLSVLMERRRDYAIDMAAENAEKAATQSQYALRTIRAGVAEGRLIGGNLSIVTALIGTPYAAEIRDKLLFLEEVGEAPYRVDRMLTQLQQSHGIGHAAGTIMGVFQKSDAPAGEASLTLEEVLDDHFGSEPSPSVYGYSFGHIAHQFTIPVGVRARLDTRAQRLTLLEAAVTDAVSG